MINRKWFLSGLIVINVMLSIVVIGDVEVAAFLEEHIAAVSIYAFLSGVFIIQAEDIKL